MNAIFDYTMVTLFLLSTILLATYGVHLYILVYLFRRRSRQKIAEQRAFIDRYIAEVPQ